MLIAQRTMVFFAIATILLLQPLSASAQWSLDINGIELSLGMDRQTVLTKFNNYRVTCADSKQLTDCDSLLVQSHGPPFVSHANVVFQGGKVKSVRKYWSRGYEGSKPDKFVQTLYSLLSNQAREGVTQYQVSVSERRDPGLIWQTIRFTSGRKTISISHFDIPDPDEKTLNVSLDEMIE